MSTREGISGRGLVDFGPMARNYDRWYTTPEGMKHDAVQKADVLRILGPAGTPSRLLDLGCGTGHWSRFFTSLGYRVTGLDLSMPMLQMVRREGGTRVTCSAGEAAALPFGDASFDVVAAMATLEFLPDPAGALREMARCVRSGGRILVGTLNRAAPLNRRRLAENKQPYASGRLLTPGALRELLEPFGSIQMAATHPVEAPGLVNPDGMSKNLSDTGVGGPFIVALVQR